MNTANEQPHPKADSGEKDDSSASAGLFVHRSGSRPLPMSGNRYVVPKLPFLKKNSAVNNKTSSATILRKTGDMAAFSDEGRGLSGDEDTIADAWICAHCSSKNHTRKREFCTICKQPKEENVPIAQPRRGRRQQHRDNNNNLRSGGAPQPSSSSLSSPRRITSSRSWSPPPVAQRLAATRSPHTTAPPAAPRQPPTIVPMNPFDALTQGASPQQQPPVVSPTPSYNNHGSNSTPAACVTPDQATSRTRTGVAVETVDSSDSDEEFYSPPKAAAPYQQQTTPQPSPTVSARSTPQQQQQSRASSPAFSCTTSVDTPIASNRRQDPFAPYPQSKTNNVLRPIESQGSGKFQVLTRPKFGQDWEGGTLV